jgi:hypothetical protein
MTASDIDKAERISKARSRIMAFAAVVLLIQAVLGVGDEASSMTPVLRHATWGIMVLFWLIILATGGWLRLGRNLRSLINDEVSLANRGLALQTGFWAAMLLALTVYFASLFWTISVREALRVVTDLSISAALIRYAWLETR